MVIIDLARARAERIHRTATPARMLGYAVLDVETTGLRPGGHDRIVEIAILRVQELLAAGAGLVPMPSVTRSLDILVLADPASQSGKRKKAESYGIRMIAERSFWPALGIPTD